MRFLLFFSLFFAFTQCKKAENSIEIKLDLTVNGESLVIGKVHKDKANRNIIFNSFKVYLSDIEITDGSNSVNNDVLLFNAEKNSLSYVLPSSSFNNKITVSGNIGLDTNYNNRNPLKYEEKHPLSLDQNMYWSMLKYRFLVIEGRIDTSAAGNKTPNFPFTYHIGSDVMLRDFSFTVEDKNISIPIEILDIFQYIDLADDFDNHSETEAQLEIGIIVMDNLQCIINRCIRN